MAVNVGQGTILKMTISSTLTAIAQVKEIDGPEVTVPDIDKTNLADVFRRKRAGLPDPGKLTATIQYDPADSTHQAMTTLINTWPQVSVNWTVTYNTQSGTAHDSFTAFLSKFHKKGMNQDDNLEADIELTLDGLPVATP